ncbi:MAG: T9SS type A sorting domain-containing protein [Bacteroidetes bacterium]|nr:T9SS type A sorting domain-containing protein [Bacteroidota bacterium]
MRLLLFLALFPLVLQAQIPVVPQLRALLPDTLSESSGLEFVSDTSLWSHNDSGDPGTLYQIDTTATIRRSLHLRGVSPYDCEDLAQDNTGNFYLGDFGNNANNRQDLRIYKIPPPQSITTDSITPQLIEFSFADQTAFPPPAAGQNFDCEAMFHFNGSLYVFSKNRGTSTYCRMYKMPDTAGVYSLMPVDSFNTQQWITSADISPAGTEMVLFSEFNIYLFRNFTGDNFFQGNVTRFTMTPYTQKEAVVFATDSLLWLTDEVLLNFGGKLYTIDIPAALSVSALQPQETTFTLCPNPAADELMLQCGEANYTWQLYTLQNQLVQSGFSFTSTTYINTSALQPGTYQLRIITAAGQTGSQLIIRTQ